jgi:hypothetical protein
MDVGMVLPSLVTTCIFHDATHSARGVSERQLHFPSWRRRLPGPQEPPDDTPLLRNAGGSPTSRGSRVALLQAGGRAPSFSESVGMVWEWPIRVGVGEDTKNAVRPVRILLPGGRLMSDEMECLDPEWNQGHGDFQAWYGSGQGPGIRWRKGGGGRRLKHICVSRTRGAGS